MLTPALLKTSPFLSLKTNAFNIGYIHTCPIQRSFASAENVPFRLEMHIRVNGQTTKICVRVVAVPSLNFSVLYVPCLLNSPLIPKTPTSFLRSPLLPPSSVAALIWPASGHSCCSTSVLKGRADWREHMRLMADRRCVCQTAGTGSRTDFWARCSRLLPFSPIQVSLSVLRLCGPDLVRICFYSVAWKEVDSTLFFLLFKTSGFETGL